MSGSERSSEDEEREEMAEAEPRSPVDGIDLQLEVFDAVRSASDSPVTPVRLGPEDDFNFRCHPGVSCWNRCCHGADITLTPNCILRLSRRLEMRPAEFLAAYTLPALFHKADLPVAKLKMGGDDGKGPCPFVGERGCTVYDDRPATCRYYPLGVVSMKMKDMDAKEDFHFLVKEEHCRGHDETKSQSVGAFRLEQGVAEYERVNRGWVDILMKMASWAVLGGPGGKAPTAQTRRMFFMATTDVDAFRRFVLETRFLSIYEVAPDAVEIIRGDDEALLRLGYDWLKNVLFNEPTLAMKDTVLQGAIAKARETMGAG